MSDQRRRGAGDRQLADVGGGGGVAAGDGRLTTVPPASCPDLPGHHHHHQHQQQQQQKLGMAHHTHPSSTLAGTFDRVSLTERVWNLGRVTRSAAVHALRHSVDGVRTCTPCLSVCLLCVVLPDYNTNPKAV